MFRSRGEISGKVNDNLLLIIITHLLVHCTLKEFHLKSSNYNIIFIYLVQNVLLLIGKKILFRVLGILCSSRKYPYSPHRRDWNFQRGGGGVGGSVRPKNLKKCMKLNWNFPSMGEVGIFFGTTHCKF